MDLRALSERISYIPASEQPLSADVGIIRGDEACWIFDVGSSEAARDAIQRIEQKKMIVLSHFHEDHVGNLKSLNYCELYCGAYACARFQCATAVQSPRCFDDGIKLRVFPIPCTHSKDALGLEVDAQYAFLGDAVYGRQKQGRMVYNVNLLKETITVLESLQAQWFLISHSAAFMQPKHAIVAQLKALYSRRRPGEAFILSEE